MNTRPQAGLPYLELARQAARIVRQIDLCELSRLEDLVVEVGSKRSDAPLEVDLQFGLAPDGLVRVHGAISGDVGLICHGCAEALPYHLAIDFDCMIVGSDEAARQADARAEPGGRPEALIVAGGREISLAEIVEDEILLALPERLCRVDPCDRAPRLAYPAEPGSAAEDAVDEAGERDNPFSVLAELKKTRPTE